MAANNQDKKAYLINSKLKGYKQKVQSAIDTAQIALSQSKKALISFSGGKDSIVLLDIICKAGFEGEMIFFRYGICTEIEIPQETIDIVTYYADKCNLKCNTIHCLGEFDCWDELGYFCVFPQTQKEKRVFNKTNTDYAKKSLEFEKAYGCDLTFIGLRKGESKQRSMMLSKKGMIYTTASRQSVTCCPIANFTGVDIWTYIFSNDLRYPSFYDYPFESRERIRNEPCLLYTDSIFRHGAVEVFKDIFPVYIDEIKKRYPESSL